MYSVTNLTVPPEQLVAFVGHAYAADGVRFRRRTVLTRAAAEKWLLVCCTVEALLGPCPADAAVSTHQYPSVVLYEDWLTTDECRRFVEDIQRGRITFGTFCIERRANASWRLEMVPLKNAYMHRAGAIASTRFEESPFGFPAGPLLAAAEPYYPDLGEAARDWLPFTVYHGDRDARNQEIVFLLPEARAYFAGAASRDGVLEIEIDGRDAKRLPLVVKGAYWDDSAIRHFAAEVEDGKAIFQVPNHVDRIEYVLMDSGGMIYDFQREDRFSDSGLRAGSSDAAAHSFAEQVRSACLDGEGMQTEFKPFVACDEGMGKRSGKTKLRELVMTAVSFANTHGGRIYIGVDDECGITGIGPDLAKWAKAEVTSAAADRYRGALTARIRDNVVGDVSLRVSHGMVEGALIIVVDVAESDSKPAVVRGDNTLYVRAGASNRQVPPDQWASMLGKSTPDGLAQFD